MLLFDGVAGLVTFALWVFCVIDVITTDASRCRNLDKTMWVVIVLFTYVLGAVVWLVAGRTWPQHAGAGRGRAHDAGYPEYDRPGRFEATDPDQDDEFLRDVRARAEEQRAAYRRRQREQERAEHEQREERRRQREEQAARESDDEAS